MMQWCTAAARRRPALVLAALAERMAQVGLELHPDKTAHRVLQGRRPPRLSMSTSGSTSWATRFVPDCRRAGTEKHFVNFSPAVCDDARKAIGREIRSWQHRPAQ